MEVTLYQLIVELVNLITNLDIVKNHLQKKSSSCPRLIKNLVKVYNQEEHI